MIHGIRVSTIKKFHKWEVTDPEVLRAIHLMTAIRLSELFELTAEKRTAIIFTKNDCLFLHAVLSDYITRESGEEDAPS